MSGQCTKRYRIKDNSTTFPLIIQYVQYSVEYAPQVTAVLFSLSSLIFAISKSYKNFTEGKNFALALRQTDYIAEILKNLHINLEQIAIPTSNKIVLRNTGKLLFLASKSLLIVLVSIKETANIGEILVKMRKG